MSCAYCVEQRLAFALQKVGKGRLTLKEKQLSVIRSAYDQEDAFAWLLTGVWQVDRVQVFTFLFHHKLNRLDGRTSSVVLVVSPWFGVGLYLASFPGRFVGGRKTAWYRLFAHARNIPFIQRIFSSIIL